MIGAGPCGLSLLTAFQKVKCDEVEVVCFEKQDSAGGLWNYTWRVGVDQYGEPLPNSMYRHLWSNAPKECLEFEDYSFMEHFKTPIPSYPPRQVLQDYLLGRAKKNGILSSIHFNTVVRLVEEIDGNQKFRVVSFDNATKKTKAELFDYVIVATGHFSYPVIPEYPGVSEFPGRIIHAHDFRDARDCSGQMVLIVGSSYSAEDIGVQCHKYGAKHVTMCYRTSPTGFNWPSGIEELPCLTKLSGSTAHFEDGSTRNVDIIVFCTGYQHVFPFLPDHLQLKTTNNLYPNGLYKGVIWQQNPRLLYLGMQNQLFSFPMFDGQARYARNYILEKISMPSEEERKADIELWFNRAQQLECFSDIADFQAEYVKELNKVRLEFSQLFSSLFNRIKDDKLQLRDIK